MKKNDRLNLSLMFISLAAVALISAGMREDQSPQSPAVVSTQAQSQKSPRNGALTEMAAGMALDRMQSKEGMRVGPPGNQVGLDGYAVGNKDVSVDFKHKRAGISTLDVSDTPQLDASVDIEVKGVSTKFDMNPLRRPRVPVIGFGL